jgi:glutamine synthetase
MKLGIDKIPPILLDNTDRNRTSPFAFTGNKFEFRAVGSSANSALPMTTLNTIVANQLQIFHAEVEAAVEKGEKLELAIINILRRYITESKAIRFEGNNYSEEWKQEAQKRGLSNYRSTYDALQAAMSEHCKEVFVKNGIFTEVELEARHEIQLEKYAQQIQIESRLLGDLAMNNIVPSAIAYQQRLLETISQMRQIGLESETEVMVDTVRRIAKHVTLITHKVKAMINARKDANALDVAESAKSYSQSVKPYFDDIRYSIDKLELLIDDELWKMPKYRELLFIR